VRTDKKMTEKIEKTEKELEQEYIKKMHTNVNKKPFPFVDVIKGQVIGYTSQCKHCFQCGRIKAECTHPKADVKFCLFSWYSGDRIPDHLCYNYEANPNWKSVSTDYFFNRKAVIKDLETKEKIKVDKTFYEETNKLNEMIYKPYGIYIIGSEKVDIEKIKTDYPFLTQTPVKKLIFPIPVIEDEAKLHEYIFNKTLEMIDFSFLPNIKIKSNEIDDNYFQKVCKIINDIESFMSMNLVTRLNHSEEIQINEIMNLSWINSSYWAYDFKESCKGKNILCIAGGPSLNSQLDWIKTNRNKFIIFSATTVANILFEKGIIPDLIGNIDMKVANRLYLEAISKYDLSQTKLLFELDSNYETINYYKGEKITLIADIDNMPIVQNEFPDENYKVPKSGTVSNMLYSFAVMCKPNAIYLAGYDLCYNPGNTHVEGAKYNRKVEIVINNDRYWLKNGDSLEPLYEIKDNLGNRTFITEQFQTYFEDLVGLIKNNSIKTYDLASNGSKKENAEYIDINNIKIQNDSYFSDVYLNLNKKRFKDKFVRKLISNAIEKEDNKAVLENHKSSYTYQVKQLLLNPYLEYQNKTNLLYEKMQKEATKEMKVYVDKSLKLFDERKRKRK
jgi:hypothetical protein